MKREIQVGDKVKCIDFNIPEHCYQLSDAVENWNIDTVYTVVAIHGVDGNLGLDSSLGNAASTTPYYKTKHFELYDEFQERVKQAAQQHELRTKER